MATTHCSQPEAMPGSANNRSLDVGFECWSDDEEWFEGGVSGVGHDQSGVLDGGVEEISVSHCV